MAAAASAASAAKVSENDADNTHHHVDVNNIALKEIDAKGAVFAGKFEGPIDARVSNDITVHNHEDIVQLYKESISGKISADWCTIEGWVTNLPGSHRMAFGTFRGRECMFKMLNGSDDDMMLKESELMRKLSRSCVNICPCFGVVEFPSDYKNPAELAGKRFSVFEKQPYTLDMVLKSSKINNIIRFVLTTGLLRALAFMSQSQPPVVHGDLATPQVLVNKGYQAVLIDLNASIELKTMMTKTAASASKLGLYQWKAPELFKGKSKTRESDVYAFGLLLFTIWRCDAVSASSGEIEQPWGELDISEVAELVKSGSRPATLEELIEDHEIPHIISNIIVSAWAQKPADRLAGAGIAGIRNLFDTHGEAVLELPEDEYPGWLKFSSPPSSPKAKTSSPTKSQDTNNDDKYSYVDGIEGVDDDCKSILKKNKMTLEVILDEETSKQDLLDVGIALVDVKKILKWIEWKKQQTTEFTEAQQALEKEESAARVVIEEEETSTEKTLQLDHVKTSVVTTCGNFKNVAEKFDELEPECKEAVKKKEAASKTHEKAKKVLEEAKKACENAKREAEVAVVKEKQLSESLQKLAAEREAVLKQVGEVENVALSLMSMEELSKLKSEKNVVYESKAEREAKEEAEKKAKEEAERKAKEAKRKRNAILFKIDETTPHDGITVGPGNLLTKVSNGSWITVRTTLPLSSSCRKFAVRVLDVGQGSDASGLMIGLLPSTSNTASFGASYIASLGGWCFSRAGTAYGSWKLDTSMPFGKGDVVKFVVDVSSKTVNIECSGKSTVGHITGAFLDYGELFPAVSMCYGGQKLELLEEYPESEEEAESRLFKIDETTPHDGITVASGNLLKKVSTTSWVTVRTTLPLSYSCHKFAVRVLDVGQSTDGTNLMIGLLPRAASITPTHIGSSAGWALSRAGTAYGSWKLDTSIPFVAGDIVKFVVDVSSKTVRIECGGKSTIGHITGDFPDYGELFPAVSMYYADQKVELLQEYPEEAESWLFKIDETTPHETLTIAPRNLLTKVSNSWVTVRTTLPLSSSCRKFAVRVLDVGQSTDGSNLMIGLLPRVSSITPTHIGSLAGWALSRAGTAYGSWKLDTSIPFVAGDIVKFVVDVSSKTVNIECSGKSTVGHITGAFLDYGELFPAVSMHQTGAKVRLLEKFPES